MMRKLLVLVLCGFVQQVACSRMRFEQTFHEPLYRQDPQLQGGPILKREHFFPRGSIMPTEQMMPQPTLVRTEPIFANNPIMSRPSPQQIASEEFLPSDHIIQTQPIIRNEALMRPEPVIQREAYIRREPVLRRAPFTLNERCPSAQCPCPLVPTGEAFIRGDRPEICRNEPNAYAFFVSRCECPEQTVPQEAFFQMPQPQPILAHRIIIQKPILKPQIYQPIMSVPRVQRFMRKGFKAIPENVQFASPSSSPVQDFNSFDTDPSAFSGNFQNQGQQLENTSEPSQKSSVTVRNSPQVPNSLSLAQVSSIC